MLDSLSNVSFTFIAFDGILGSPIPPNSPLQSRENYSNTSTLVSSSIDNVGTFSYFADVFIENSTAQFDFSTMCLMKEQIIYLQQIQSHFSYFFNNR
ncbi:MAG: hypothetical protein EAX90_01825 [Candidatus Heimdallarchaeota archaeon]|nr:hypothetical protein [Candidatus Heimdallarchaeota archaeon]